MTRQYVRTGLYHQYVQRLQSLSGQDRIQTGHPPDGLGHQRAYCVLQSKETDGNADEVECYADGDYPAEEVGGFDVGGGAADEAAGEAFASPGPEYRHDRQNDAGPRQYKLARHPRKFQCRARLGVHDVPRKYERDGAHDRKDDLRPPRQPAR